MFATADGELMIVAANDRLYAKACDVLGAPELASDPRFATNPLRVANRDELIPLLQARIATQTTADLLARLREAGVPASPVNDLADVAAEEQLRATGILQELAGRRARVAAVLGRRRARPLPLRPAAARRAHRRDPRARPATTSEEIAELAAAGVVRVAEAK